MRLRGAYWRSWIYRKGAKGAEGRGGFWVKRNAELRRTRRETGRETRREMNIEH